MAKRGKNPGRSRKGGRGSRINRDMESGSQSGREQGGRGRQSNRSNREGENLSDRNMTDTE